MHTIGAMDERSVQGKFKMQAHITSGVVMDTTAFKVSHSSGFDKDATALPAARARSVSIGAMERYTWVRFAGNSPPATTHTCTTVSNFSGAMAESSGKFKLQARTETEAVFSYMVQ